MLTFASKEAGEKVMNSNRWLSIVAASFLLTTQGDPASNKAQRPKQPEKTHSKRRPAVTVRGRQ